MDEVVGTAILVRGNSGSAQLLYLLAKPEGKEPRITAIEVHEEGTQKVADVSWTYRVEGDRLHMLPSLHIRYKWPEEPFDWRTEFHNGYNWTVKFKLAEPGSGYRQLREANGMPIADYD